MENAEQTQQHRWEAPLEKSLRLGFADSSLTPHLDELLRWYTRLFLNSQQGQSIAAYPLAKRLSDDLGEQGFRQRFEDFLDRLIFSNEEAAKNLFSGTRNDDEAKWRYRKLMSVFHPDKGVNSSDWLNFRAEKVNEIYARFQARGQRSEQNKFDTSVKSNVRRKKRKVVNATGAKNGSRPLKRGRRGLDTKNWRDFFGDPSMLEKRLIAFVVISCVAALFVLSLSLVLGG